MNKDKSKPQSIRFSYYITYFEISLYRFRLWRTQRLNSNVNVEGRDKLGTKFTVNIYYLYSDDQVDKNISRFDY